MALAIVRAQLTPSPLDIDESDQHNNTAGMTTLKYVVVNMQLPRLVEQDWLDLRVGGEKAQGCKQTRFGRSQACGCERVEVSARSSIQVK